MPSLHFPDSFKIPIKTLWSFLYNLDILITLASCVQAYKASFTVIFLARCWMAEWFLQVPTTVIDNVWEINMCPALYSVLCTYVMNPHWVGTVIVFILHLSCGGTERLSSLTQATQSLQVAESGHKPCSLTPEAHSKPSQDTASSAVGEVGRFL